MHRLNTLLDLANPVAYLNDALEIYMLQQEFLLYLIESGLKVL